ncbi:MAG TPA: carbohydrate ABC transporter permease [Anaerolineae bacterium]|nr:carbohydrate ABC transporter permease [Anaerolineae bacterium]
MFLFLTVSVIPFIWTLLNSFKTEMQTNSRMPVFWFTPTLESYRIIWLNSIPADSGPLILGLVAIIAGLLLLGIFAERLPFPRTITNWVILAGIVWLLWAIPQFVDTAEFYRYFINSLIVSMGTVIVSVSIACFSGHALARYAGIGGIVLLIAALTLNSLPRMGYLLPYYWMGQRTGLYDTYLLVIITMVAVNQPFSIWLLRGFFKDVPHEIEEAAMIDGASRFAAFVRVIFPIAWPGIFATGLLTLIIAYHEFLLVKILTLSNWTLSVAMAQFLPGISVAGSIPRQSAAAISATIPIVIVLLIFQKQLVKGLVTGAVKG